MSIPRFSVNLDVVTVQNFDAFLAKKFFVVGIENSTNKFHLVVYTLSFVCGVNLFQTFVGLLQFSLYYSYYRCVCLQCLESSSQGWFVVLTTRYFSKIFLYPLTIAGYPRCNYIWSSCIRSQCKDISAKKFLSISLTRSTSTAASTTTTSTTTTCLPQPLATLIRSSPM